MAAAFQRAKLRVLTEQQIDHVRKRIHRRKREPVAQGLGHTELLLQIVGEVAQRVSLRHPPLVVDVLVATGETHRLERDDRHLVGVVHGKLDDAPDLAVVHASDDRHDQHHVDARGREVLDGAELHVEEILDLPVRVRFVSDAVELEVTDPEPRGLRLPAELRVLGEANAVRRALHAEVANLPRVADGFEKMRRERRLAARKLHAELTARLHRNGVVEDLLDVFPGRLVHEADLVCVHETRIAHHVAAIREVHREDGAASVFHRRFSVLAQRRRRRREVASGKQPLDAREKCGIDADHVFERAMAGAGFSHHDAPIAFDDFGGNFPGVRARELGEIELAGEHRGARFLHAGGAERVRLARPTERRKRAVLLAGERRRCPFGF